MLLRDVIRGGVQYINICLVAVQGLKGMADIDRGVTNSGKARFYSTSRLFGDEDLLQIAMTGKLAVAPELANRYCVPSVAEADA